MVDFSDVFEMFSTFPLEVLAVVVFFPILFIMIYDYWYNKKHGIEERVKEYLNKEDRKNVLDKVVSLTNDYLGKKGDKIQLKLERANIHFKKEEYLTLLVIGIAGGFFIGFVLFPFGGLFKVPFKFIHSPIVQIAAARLLAGISFASAGYLLPEFWIRYLIRKRKQLLHDQIEEALLQIADALRSGVGISSAIRIAANELKYPMKDEFAITAQEISANKPFNDAINDLIARVNLSDFTFAMNAIQIQNETGAKLEPLLREIVKTISDRKVLKKEIEKAITSSKTTGIVMMIFPLAFIALIGGTSPEQITLMLKTQIGFLLTVVAVVSYFIGSAIIIKIIRDVSKLS